MNEKVQLERVVRFYEGLELSTVCEVRTVYTPDAYFKDPFNEVGGHDAIIRIFDLGGALDLDLAGAISEKMQFNQVRPDHQIAARLRQRPLRQHH